MDEKGLDLFLKRILKTEEHEISCSECFDLVSVYVDRELSGSLPDRAMKRIALHLEQCRACREEYEILRDLVQFESSRQIPSLQDLLRSYHPRHP